MVRSHLAAEVLVMYSRMVGLRTGELRLSSAPIALRAYGLRSGQASLAALNFTDTVRGELEGQAEIFSIARSGDVHVT